MVLILRHPTTSIVSQSSLHSRTTRILWAAGLGWGYQAMAMVAGLWLTKFLLGRIGDATMGWWTHSLVMLGYIVSVDLGLSALLPRDVARQTGKAGGWENAQLLPGVIASWMKFAMLQLPLAIIVAVVCVVVMSRNDESRSIAAACVMAFAVVVYPLRISSLTINGLQDFRYEGLVQFTTFLTGLATTVSLAFFFDGPICLIGGWAMQIVLTHSLMWGRLFHKYRTILPTAHDVISSTASFSMFKTGIWAWLGGVGVTLTGTAETIAIGYFAKEAWLFNYACTVKLVIVLSPLALSLGVAMLPGLTELRSSGNSKGMERATVAYTQIVLAISGLFGCVIATLNPSFVEWWLEDQRFLGDFVTLTAIFGMNLKHIQNAVSIAMFSLGLEKQLWILTFFVGVLSLVSAFIVVHIYGPRAAALGPVSIAAIAVLTMLVLIARKEPTLAARLTKSVAVWGGHLCNRFRRLLFCCSRRGCPQYH